MGPCACLGVLLHLCGLWSHGGWQEDEEEKEGCQASRTSTCTCRAASGGADSSSDASRDDLDTYTLILHGCRTTVLNAILFSSDNHIVHSSGLLISHGIICGTAVRSTICHSPTVRRSSTVCPSFHDHLLCSASSHDHLLCSVRCVRHSPAAPICSSWICSRCIRHRSSHHINATEHRQRHLRSYRTFPIL